MAADEVHVEVEDLSRRFLSGDPRTARPFMKAIRPMLLRFARKYAWGLARDQYEDVVQQTMLRLHEGMGDYNPDRGSAVTFIGLIARRAAREVSAQYSAAGCPT